MKDSVTVLNDIRVERYDRCERYLYPTDCVQHKYYAFRHQFNAILFM